MLQHDTRPRANARSRAVDAPEESAPAADKQTRLGNAALQAQIQTSQQAPAAVSNDELGSWLGDDVELPSKRGPDAPEAVSAGGTAPVVDPTAPMRPSKFKRGQNGALIAGTKTIELAENSDGSGSAGTVNDGVGAEIIAVSGSMIQVQARSGDKNIEGWIDSGKFADEPAINIDEDHPELRDDYGYHRISGDHSPVDPKTTDAAQGSLGDCFLVASLAAIANSSPQTIKDAITYNASTGTYSVRFYEEKGRNNFTPVQIEVDAYLPSKANSKDDPAYAGDKGGVMWVAIAEKAYAKWKGGYDVIGEGGVMADAMQEISGVKSLSKQPSQMKEDEVIPFFQQCEKDGRAVCAGVRDNSKSDEQTPFSSSGGNTFKGHLKQSHEWNHVDPGTVRITDTQGKAGSARDVGGKDDESGKISGTNVDDGSIIYKGAGHDNIEMTYKDGKGPDNASDLKVQFSYEGVMNAQKLIIGNHAYVFQSVVGGKEIQFYNPWGSYQPKSVTAAEFLDLFDSLSTNLPKKA
jgi:hypothetical protein